MNVRFLIPAVVWFVFGANALGVTTATQIKDLIQLQGERPVQGRVKHNLTYSLKKNTADLHSIDARFEHINVAMFGGHAQVQGHMRLADNATTDVQLSVTLAQVDVEQVMRGLQLPRAGQVAGRVGGVVQFALAGKKLTQGDVNLAFEEGTARIHRELLATMLGFNLDAGILKRYNAQMDQTFGADPMIPLSELTISGSLDKQVLKLKLPLNNAAMASTLEPRIEVGIIWSAIEMIQAQMKRAQAQAARTQAR